MIITGITLDFATRQKLSHEKIMQVAEEYATSAPERTVVEVSRPGITRTVERVLKNKDQVKTFQAVQTKRVLCDDAILRPYGYSNDELCA